MHEIVGLRPSRNETPFDVEEFRCNLGNDLIQILANAPTGPAQIAANNILNSTDQAFINDNFDRLVEMIGEEAAAFSRRGRPYDQANIDANNIRVTDVLASLTAKSFTGNPGHGGVLGWNSRVAHNVITEAAITDDFIYEEREIPENPTAGRRRAGSPPPGTRPRVPEDERNLSGIAIAAKRITLVVGTIATVNQVHKASALVRNEIFDGHESIPAKVLETSAGFVSFAVEGVALVLALREIQKMSPREVNRLRPWSTVMALGGLMAVNEFLRNAKQQQERGVSLWDLTAQHFASIFNMADTVGAAPRDHSTLNRVQVIAQTIARTLDMAEDNVTLGEKAIGLIDSAFPEPLRGWIKGVMPSVNSITDIAEFIENLARGTNGIIAGYLAAEAANNLPERVKVFLQELLNGLVHAERTAAPEAEPPVR